MEDYKYLTKDMPPSEMLRAIKALNGKWQMLTLLGWSVDDIAGKPVIAIANTCSDICPGHVNLRQVSDAVKNGIIQAGGIPVEFGTIGVCDVSQNGYVLPTRDVICDSIELMVGAHEFDGLVLLGSCDKIVPGMLMAAARCNLPTIMVTGGPALGGPGFNGRAKTENTAAYEAWGMYQAGKISLNDVLRVTKTVMPTIGSCSYYGTANTMSCISEALGLQLPDGGAAPAVYADRLRIAKASGVRAVELVRQNIRARDILNFESLQNAIAFLMATGGSTNAILHLTALANELGIEAEKIMNEFDRISEKIPQIARIYPSGTEDYLMEDFYFSGGVPRVMEYLKTELNLNDGGDKKQLMGALWRQNRKLVYKIAERYKGYMPLEGLMQEGYIALDNAAKLFDGSMGCAFSTYLVSCLKRRFYRLCAEKGSMIHIPQHMYVKLMDFKRKEAELTARLKRKPLMAELMIYTGLNRKEIKALNAAAAAVIVKSLDTPIGGDDQDITLADMVADQRDDIGDSTEDISRQQESAAIWSIVDELPDKQGDIIKERYIRSATLEETAKVVGISKSRVFTQEMKAMQALKSPAYAKRLLLYYDGVRSRAMHGTGAKRFNETWTSATEREALRLCRYL